MRRLLGSIMVAVIAGLLFAISILGLDWIGQNYLTGLADQFAKEGRYLVEAAINAALISGIYLVYRDIRG